MTRAWSWWVLGAVLAVALGASACGSEDEEPGAADPALMAAPAEQLPGGQAPAAVAAPAALAQPAAVSVRPSPGSLASSNWYPNPPPCTDCPVAPINPAAVGPTAPAPVAR